MIAWAVDRGRTTLSIMSLIILTGLYSYAKIPVEADHIQVPIFIITILHEGISPEDRGAAAGHAHGTEPGRGRR